MKLQSIAMNKKGQLARNTVVGIGSLVITLIIAFVVISQITGANLLTANSAEDNATDRLTGNLSSGVNNISTKIPTFFTIIAAVLILGFVVLLWRQFQGSGLASGGSL